MAQPKRVRRVEQSEGDKELALYRGMLETVKDMHVDSLELESGVNLAKVLQCLAILQVTIEKVIEGVMEEKEIAKATEALLSKEDVSG